MSKPHVAGAICENFQCTISEFRLDCGTKRKKFRNLLLEKTSGSILTVSFDVTVSSGKMVEASKNILPRCTGRTSRRRKELALGGANQWQLMHAHSRFDFLLRSYVYVYPLSASHH